MLKDGEWQSIFLAHHIFMKIDENGQYVIDITIAPMRTGCFTLHSYWTLIPQVTTRF